MGGRKNSNTRLSSVDGAGVLGTRKPGETNELTSEVGRITAPVPQSNEHAHVRQQSVWPDPPECGTGLRT